MRPLAWFLTLAAVTACTEKKAEPLKALAPKPLPPLLAPGGPGDGGEDRDEVYRVEAAPVFGEAPPANALRLALDGAEAVDLAGVGEGTPVLLVPSGEVYLVQVAALLARLEDARAATYLAHPEGQVAFRIRLRDEPGFQAWLDEPKPGKVRIIQRADGFELQTNVGKLPGADPNGPTVPLRGGKDDLATLRRGLAKLKERFDVTPDVCFVPSFGTPMSKVAAAMTADYEAAEKPIFDELCLVYPRPGVSDR